MANQDSLFPIVRNRSRGRCRRGFDDWLKSARAAGRIEPVDAAFIALARVTADELDAAIADRDESRYTRGTLVRVYLSCLDHLPGGHDGTDADDFTAMYARLVDDPGYTGTVPGS